MREDTPVRGKVLLKTRTGGSTTIVAAREVPDELMRGNKGQKKSWLAPSYACYKTHTHTQCSGWGVPGIRKAPAGHGPGGLTGVVEGQIGGRKMTGETATMKESAWKAEGRSAEDCAKVGCVVMRGESRPRSRRTPRRP